MVARSLFHFFVVALLGSDVLVHSEKLFASITDDDQETCLYKCLTKDSENIFYSNA